MTDATTAALDRIERACSNPDSAMRLVGFTTSDVLALVAEVRRLRAQDENRTRYVIGETEVSEAAYWRSIAVGMRAERDRLREAAHVVASIHRPADVDDRLCAEGCGGGWPCSTHAEVVDLLDGQENGRDPDDGMTDDEAADAFLAALDQDVLAERCACGRHLPCRHCQEDTDA